MLFLIFQRGPNAKKFGKPWLRQIPILLWKLKKTSLILKIFTHNTSLFHKYLIKSSFKAENYFIKINDWLTTVYNISHKKFIQYKLYVRKK